MQLLGTYILTAIVFFLVDLTWLGFIAKDWYARHMGHLMRESVNWPVAIIFYLLFIIGLFVFVILPATEKGSFRFALMYGALFGLFTYATYDLTNLAVLKDFPAGIVIGDIIWGMTLSSIVSGAGYVIHRWILGL
ncbi:MAG: DUF2177 family protein [Saprospiraceae bacterium]|nr:DUF2177 family protein [Saprospiraceae bacterium]